MTISRIVRVILPVTDIDKAARFYGHLLGIPGERVSLNRHHFNLGSTILVCLDPQPGGRNVTPNPETLSFAVSNLDDVYERAKQAGCQWLDENVKVQHWGERSFFAKDPFGNPICFVDETTLFTGGSPT